jgi:hypothetical protein
MKRFLGILSILLLISCAEKTTDKKVSAEEKTDLAMAESTAPVTVPEAFFDFEKDQTGAVPKGWSDQFTGNWKVTDDNGNKVLEQASSNHSGSYFNVIVNKDLNHKDVAISVKFKGIKGNEDQGGGPVWRYKDIKNYYIARANPLENNYRVYKVINGHRKELKSANIDIQTGKWYDLRIEMKGNRIKCYFNGKLELETTDNSFTGAGKVGLWTKADAVTYFDNMNVKGGE